MRYVNIEIKEYMKIKKKAEKWDQMTHAEAESFDKLEAIDKIVNDPYPTDPFRLQKIREILSSEFKEKPEGEK